jgi:hypothetical protein
MNENVKQGEPSSPAALLDAVRQERMRWELEATVQRVCHKDEMAVVRYFIASNIAKGVKIAEDIIASNNSGKIVNIPNP